MLLNYVVWNVCYLCLLFFQQKYRDCLTVLLEVLNHIYFLNVFDFPLFLIRVKKSTFEEKMLYRWCTNFLGEKVDPTSVFPVPTQACTNVIIQNTKQAHTIQNTPPIIVSEVLSPVTETPQPQQQQQEQQQQPPLPPSQLCTPTAQNDTISMKVWLQKGENDFFNASAILHFFNCWIMV